jgi:hypothetical protein
VAATRADVCVCACVRVLARARVSACVLVCESACVSACVRVCVRACGTAAHQAEQGHAGCGDPGRVGDEGEVDGGLGHARRGAYIYIYI